MTLSPDAFNNLSPGRTRNRSRKITGAILFVILLASLWSFFTSPLAAADEAPRGEQAEVATGSGHSGSENHGADHSDPVAPVILSIAFVLVVAKIGGHVAETLRQPAVLGELMVGILIGSSILVLPDTPLAQLVEQARQNGSHLDILARIGVIVLLFEVGLESSLDEMVAVGWTSLIVAVVGVIAPMAIGYGVSQVFVKEFPPGVPPAHAFIFIGAILAATSVGITARVFKDLNKVECREAKIVLGAAVIDDVLGLIILAVIGGVIVADESGTGADQSVWMIGAITTGKAILFLGLAVFAGIKLAPYGFRVMARLKGSGLLIATSLGFCFVLAFLANWVGLATIVGAFAAGLVLGEAHVGPFLTDEEHLTGKHALAWEIHPVSAILVPLFFVQMGISVRLETFARMDVLVLALALTVAAIIGKQVCGFPVKGSLWSRMTIGFGMIPRGEVGLIFAAIGQNLGVVSDSTFSAIVIMVIVTTLITPPLLKFSMSKLPPANLESTA